MEPKGITVKEALQNQIDEVMRLWEESKKKSKATWTTAVAYILEACDYFVRSIEPLVHSGPDKKATVLDGLGKVYDLIVPALLPFFLKPFNSKIRSFVLNVLASLIIDFIVSKYNNGYWVPEVETTESK